MKKYALLLLVVLLLTACSTPQAAAPTQPTTAAQPEADWGRTVTRNGHTWRYNSRLTTVLFLGVDTAEGKEEDNYIGNGGRSDTMILLVLNPDKQSTRTIFISRDTMAEVTVYNQDREKLYDGFMQITMQYAYGDNAKRSCMLSKKAVSKLLLDLPVDYYCSMTLDGIAAAVNALGGLTLTLEQDWTDIHPSYTAGSTVNMDAAMVSRFLRYRDLETSGSNTDRIQRQSWFVRQVFDKLIRSGSLSADQVVETVRPYLETDMNADTIQALSSYKLAPEMDLLPGGVVAGKRHDEFYVDEEAMKDLLIDIFYYRVS